MQISDEMVERAANAIAEKRGYAWPGTFDAEEIKIGRDNMRAALEAALSAAEPSVAVKTPFEIASKHIPEARVSLLSRAIRQGLNDYGWKNFGTLPEVLMGYIVQAEKSEAAAHPQKPRDCGHDGGDLSERRDNIGSAYTRSALTAQVQDVVVPNGWQLVPKDDENRCVADSALPHEMIEAGTRVQEQVNDDNCNYVSGETTDWDCGMVAVAIYRAMLAAAPAKQEGGRDQKS